MEIEALGLKQIQVRSITLPGLIMYFHYFCLLVRFHILAQWYLFSGFHLVVLKYQCDEETILVGRQPRPQTDKVMLKIRRANTSNISRHTQVMHELKFILQIKPCN